LNNLTKSGGAKTRLLRVLIPVFFNGLVGATILLVTESHDSDIMQTKYPFTTAFYVAIITSLSIGYGDFYPTTVAGRILFTIYIPVSVVGMLSALEELNGYVRYLRTVVSTEIVGINDILKMVTNRRGDPSQLENRH
jgi:hypothetical protein